MIDAERTNWESERVGGRKRYVWRNTVAWTLVVTVTYTAIQVGLKLFDSPGGQSWGQIGGVAALMLLTFTTANYALLDSKWRRNEAAYRNATGELELPTKVLK